jgi:hypothetical protein
MSRSNRDSTLRDVRAFEKAVAKESVFLYPSVVSEIPRLGAWPGRSAVVTFLGAWLLAFLWVRPTLRLMFRKDETVVPLPEVGLDDSVTFDADSILLAPDTRAASAYFQRRPEAYVVDFAVALRGTPPDYRNSLPLLVIDNFDYQLGVPEADAKRLEALEGLLLANPERRLLLLASTDPAFYFTESNVDSVIGRQDAVRWSRCLRRFKTVRLAGNDKPAVADFPLIWHASTASEKAALYQLARDGLANPGNWAALQHLQLRNLISGWPLEIRDPAFARYVRSVASASERRSWQKQDAADIWDGIRLTVVVVALGVLAAVLFFKQQTSLSYIVTGMGILTPLSRLLTEVRGLPGLLGFGGGKKE